MTGEKSAKVYLQGTILKKKRRTQHASAGEGKISLSKKKMRKRKGGYKHRLHADNQSGEPCESLRWEVPGWNDHDTLEESRGYC